MSYCMLKDAGGSPTLSTAGRVGGLYIYIYMSRLHVAYLLLKFNVPNLELDAQYLKSDTQNLNFDANGANWVGALGMLSARRSWGGKVAH